MLKRASRNRRFKRKHVLEVKMRTSQRRRMRLIKTTWILLLVGLTSFAIYIARQGSLAFCDWAFARNPYFNIKYLAIQTDGVIRTDQIQQWAGVRLGLNLFSLDLARVRRDLEVIPLVAACEVERVLPDTLKIRVRERVPVARFYFPHLRIPGASPIGLYTLDAEGHFMLPLESHQVEAPQDAAIEKLPLLLGMPLQELRAGRRVHAPTVRHALELIASFQRSPMAGLTVLQEIDLQKPGLLRLTTKEGAHITFGASNLDQQLRRWRAIHDYARRLGKQVVSLDLSISNNVPLVWLPIPPNSTNGLKQNPTASAPNLSPIHKKNV